MNQIEAARKKILTPELEEVAKAENLPIYKLQRDLAAGYTVILKQKQSRRKAVGLGRNLKVKINANLGTSPYCANLELELEKLKAAQKAGADTLMDLSTGGDIEQTRKAILSASSIPVGTVPIYEVIVAQPDVAAIKDTDFIAAIQKHIEEGVDFITVHAGLRRRHIPFLKKRIMGVVSRGGSFLVKWMLYHNAENPLYTHFDQILELAAKYDVVLSLGDGLRPGCLSDATDRAQLAELAELGRLQRRALRAGVQVMIEGPGHVPLQQIAYNIRLQKKLCHGAPFYVLGPLVTDISPGYDHIAGAIGGALAAFYGADFLCYLTPKEHLGLPNLEDVIEGVIASRLAAHAADLARGQQQAWEEDRRMAEARSQLDWPKMFSLALDPLKAKRFREEFLHDSQEICSMCGQFCSAKANRDMRELYL